MKTSWWIVKGDRAEALVRAETADEATLFAQESKGWGHRFDDPRSVDTTLFVPEHKGLYHVFGELDAG